MPMRRTLAGVAFAALVALPAHAQQAPRPTFDGPGGGSEQPTYAPPPTYSQPYGSGTTDPGVYADPNASGGDPALNPVSAPPEEQVGEGTAERVERQQQGRYLDIPRGAVVPLGTTQDAWSDPGANMSTGQTAPGTIRFRWSPELVMPLRVREYMITMITLPEWEKAVDVLIGEGVYFEAQIIRDNTVAVRASASGLDTSVNVIGSSGNNYTFYVRSESFNTREITDLAVFVDAAPASRNKHWFRSQGGLNAAAPAPADMTGDDADAPDIPGRPGMGAEPASAGDERAGSHSKTVAGSRWYIPKAEMQFAHKMYEVREGDREIAPETVYTNGRWTFFHYGHKAATVDRPTVYRIVDGVETLVNTRWIGDHNEVLVAEAVGDFVLRNGRRTVCVLKAQDHLRKPPREIRSAHADDPDAAETDNR